MLSAEVLARRLSRFEQLLHENFRVPIAYKFSILVIFGFFVSIFFNPLVGVPAQDSIFYVNALGATLCVLFLLGDFWVPEHDKKLLPYLWNFIIFFCLPLSASYILARSEFYFSWWIHFAIVTFLLYLITTNRSFVVLLFGGTIVGLFLGTLLNNYIPPNPAPPYEPIDINFALYSSVFWVLVVVLLLHNRFYVQKQLYVLVDKEVNERTKQLNAALRIKREFLDNVSHEIKTPVHNITNITSELYDQWDNLSEGDRFRLVEMLKDCNHRLFSLCSNLLDLSRFKKGEAGLNVKSYELQRIIDDVKNEYRVYGDKMIFELKGKTLQKLDCDIDRILQVFRNLIENALRYGCGSVINILVDGTDKNALKISVSDKGVGVPESELSSVFYPFEQSSVTKTRAGGTGLGLSICKKIVEMHFGKIWAENNEHGGATFSFIVPYKHERDES